MGPNLYVHALLGPTIVEIQGVEMLALVGGLCCVGFIKPSCVIAGVRRQRLALLIEPNRVGFTCRRRQNPASETSCFKYRPGE
jgi:hypothetical protein